MLKMSSKLELLTACKPFLNLNLAYEKLLVKNKFFLSSALFF